MFLRRQAAIWLCSVVMCGLLSGCQNDGSSGSDATPGEAAAAGASGASAKVVDKPRGVVELQSAVAKLDDNGVVRFDVNYKFTSGEPVKTYLCNITFPGTEQYGLKPMESFELKTEGSFKAGIEVGEVPVTEYQITFSEADSPDRGYTVISNTLTGQVEKSASAAPAGESGK